MPEVDIHALDPIKKKARYFIHLFNTFYKMRVGENVHEMLIYAGNPVIRKMAKIVDETTKSIVDFKYRKAKLMDGRDPNRYRKMIRNPIEFGLCIYYSDSAYRDLGDIMLYKLLKAADELLPYLEEQLKDPKHMYFNVWQELQSETHEAREKGYIDPSTVTESEQLMVNEIAEAKVANYIKRHQKKK